MDSADEMPAQSCSRSDARCSLRLVQQRWTAHRYAFYYAEFAEEYGRKIPLWIALLLRRRLTYTPNAVIFSSWTAQDNVYPAASA